MYRQTVVLEQTAAAIRRRFLRAYIDLQSLVRASFCGDLSRFASHVMFLSQREQPPVALHVHT